MIDFGVLPPEVNSGRMYTGPGVGPMLAAAAAWDGLGFQLGLTAASYESTLAELTGGPWLGPASMSMLSAAAPYAAWLSATAGQAEQAATQAKAAAVAYETAFAMTVPPPVIAANRALLMTLIATNFFGQNLPAIAATEAHYAEMWAQDATAMYSYAGSSADASKVTPFTSPPHTTNPAGLTGQASAVGHAASTTPGTPATPPSSTVPHTLQALAQPASPPPVSAKPTPSVPPGITNANDAMHFFLSYTNGSGAHTVNFFMRGLFNGHEFPKAVEAMNALTKTSGAAQAIGAAPAAVPGAGGGLPVATGVGQAARVGAMSVPASFPGVGAAAPPAAPALGAAAAATTGEAMGGMPGIPGAPARLVGAAGGGASFRFVPRYGYRHKVMARPLGAG